MQIVNQVAQVIRLLQDGTIICAVARRFGVSPHTVSKTQRRYQEKARYTRRTGQGCRNTATQQEKGVKRNPQNDPCMTVRNRFH